MKDTHDIPISGIYNNLGNFGSEAFSRIKFLFHTLELYHNTKHYRSGIDTMGTNNLAHKYI